MKILGSGQKSKYISALTHQKLLKIFNTQEQAENIRKTIRIIEDKSKLKNQTLTYVKGVTPDAFVKMGKDSADIDMKNGKVHTFVKPWYKTENYLVKKASNLINYIHTNIKNKSKVEILNTEHAVIFSAKQKAAIFDLI